MKVKDIYFKQYLSEEFKNSEHALPDNIRKARNTAIMISFVEIILSIISIGFYVRRRSKAILALILVTIMATIYGFVSKVRLSYWGLLLHAVYTISIIGGFYIYIILDYFLFDTATVRKGPKIIPI